MEEYQTTITRLLMQWGLPREVAELIYDYRHKEYQRNLLKLQGCHRSVSDVHMALVQRDKLIYDIPAAHTVGMSVCLSDPDVSLRITFSSRASWVMSCDSVTRLLWSRLQYAVENAIAYSQCTRWHQRLASRIEAGMDLLDPHHKDDTWRIDMY